MRPQRHDSLLNTGRIQFKVLTTLPLKFKDFEDKI